MTVCDGIFDSGWYQNNRHDCHIPSRTVTERMDKMGNVQISLELFMQLLRFHLVEDESCEKEIKQGLEKKLDRMVMRDLYGKFKNCSDRGRTGTGEKRVSGQTRSAGEFPMVNSSLMIRTGAWHAPVDGRQGEIWKGESCNERRKIRL